jgi:hypothetical protein
MNLGLVQGHRFRHFDFDQTFFSKNIALKRMIDLYLWSKAFLLCFSMHFFRDNVPLRPLI